MAKRIMRDRNDVRISLPHFCESSWDNGFSVAKVSTYLILLLLLKE